MPYITQEHRQNLDPVIEKLCKDLGPMVKDERQVLKTAGNLNYTLTRICNQVMGKPSYAKIAIITGVLENVKQEFYRRVAAGYEDEKIQVNGDVPEYTD
jgi:hypothetical protein